MAENPKLGANANFILSSMASSCLATLFMFLLLIANVVAAPSPSQAPFQYLTLSPIQNHFGRVYELSIYFNSPPAPPQEPSLSSLPPLPMMERSPNLNYGQKVGFVFLGIALGAQVFLGGFLTLKRWQLEKLEHSNDGGVRRRNSDASSLQCA